MKEKRLNKIRSMSDNKAEKKIMEFIPNVLGVNLSAVDDIRVYRQNDGQLKSIHIEFTAEPKNELYSVGDYVFYGKDLLKVVAVKE